MKLKSFKQHLAEETAEDIIKMVPSGKDAEAVYETWVFIVARLSGSNTLPTSKDVDNALDDSEINPTGKKWINNLREKIPQSKEFLRQAIQLIGADIKEVPNVPWGSSLEIIHKSINKFYANTPDKYKEAGSKENTADIVFVTSGSASKLIKILPNSELDWDHTTGVISVVGEDIKFVQISLKKGQGDARIGKLNTLINNLFGQQPQRPSQFADTNEEFEFLEEGFWSSVKSTISDVKDKIMSGVKKFIGWAQKIFSFLSRSAINVANKTIKKLQRSKIHTSVNNIINLTGNMSEEYITEKSGTSWPINAPLLKELKILDREMIKKDAVNVAYNNIVSTAAEINSLEKEGEEDFIIIDNKGTDPINETKHLITLVKGLLTKKVGDMIQREEMFPLIKLAANYASYLTFSAIFDQVKKDFAKYNKVSTAMVTFAAKLKAEAMFGNTQLPLYIVYGMGGGAHYKGTKNQFQTMTTQEVTELGKSWDVPYMVLKISQTTAKGTHNAVNALVLAGVSGSGEDVKPEYVVIQFINRSGSEFSYKIDASTTTTKWQ